MLEEPGESNRPWNRNRKTECYALLIGPSPRESRTLKSAGHGQKRRLRRSEREQRSLGVHFLEADFWPGITFG
jgi:hypothetical protein